MTMQAAVVVFPGSNREGDAARALEAAMGHSPIMVWHRDSDLPKVDLKVETSQSLFTSGYSAGQTLSIPVAHHDGNYFADEPTLDRLEDHGQIAFRYCTVDGDRDASTNPNGSARAIAGVFNDAKNVLGLMPHPENAVEPLHGSTDGKAFFKGIVEALS